MKLEQYFDHVDFSGQRLVKERFEGCYFDRCSFARTVFDECTFYGCRFDRCDFTDISIPSQQVGKTYFDIRCCCFDGCSIESWLVVDSGERVSLPRLMTIHLPRSRVN